MFKEFTAIAPGENHKEKGLPCQDAVFCKKYKNGGIIAVADGHGSEKHFRSDSGAALLAALLKDDFWFVIQIGGGKYVIIDDRRKAYSPPGRRGPGLW
jgi:serine/threonine protein phosphatase PrpC